MYKLLQFVQRRQLLPRFAAQPRPGCELPPAARAAPPGLIQLSVVVVVEFGVAAAENTRDVCLVLRSGNIPPLPRHAQRRRRSGGGGPVLFFLDPQRKHHRPVLVLALIQTARRRGGRHRRRRRRRHRRVLAGAAG